MSWAAQRRFIIMLIIGSIIVALVATVFFTTFSQAPSCTDGIQNEGETGIDCGGPCPYLCTADEQPPTVLFTTALTNAAGRTDVVASIENKNANAAAKDVPYNVTLYDAKQLLLQTVSGTLDLPPGATETVFIPGVISGKQAVANAFLTIAPSAPRWFAMAADTRILPSVLNTVQSGSPNAPSVDATLGNGSSTTLTNVQVIVLVRDAQGSVIAASRTVVPSIPAQGQATAIFTWNNAFPNAPASIEVVPVIPLP
ncbi:MAG TPA: hypothetical protein VNF51_02405 [Candidatus Paceibacterota bacterium]|nr:hypothetical protein [Candidatus Paceibacterota bacterium]